MYPLLTSSKQCVGPTAPRRRASGPTIWRWCRRRRRCRLPALSPPRGPPKYYHFAAGVFAATAYWAPRRGAVRSRPRPAGRAPFLRSSAWGETRARQRRASPHGLRRLRGAKPGRSTDTRRRRRRRRWRRGHPLGDASGVVAGARTVSGSGTAGNLLLEPTRLGGVAGEIGEGGGGGASTTSPGGAAAGAAFINAARRASSALAFTGTTPVNSAATVTTAAAGLSPGPARRPRWPGRRHQNRTRGPDTPELLKKAGPEQRTGARGAPP